MSAISITLDGDTIPPCPLCSGYGGIVTRWEEVVIDTGDGRPGGYTVGHEPAEWEYCPACEYGRSIKRKADEEIAADEAHYLACLSQETADCGF